MRDLEKQRAAVRAALRIARERAKAAGICVHCLKRPVRAVAPRTGRPSTTCEICTGEQRRRYAERVERLKLAGLCTTCGRRPCRPDCFQCEGCAPSRAAIVRHALKKPLTRVDKMMQLVMSIARKGRAA